MHTIMKGQPHLLSYYHPHTNFCMGYILLEHWLDQWAIGQNKWYAKITYQPIQSHKLTIGIELSMACEDFSSCTSYIFCTSKWQTV